MKSALNYICSTWPALMPPARIAVSEGIAETMKIVRPGSGAVMWDRSEVPYMMKPCDHVANRAFRAVCFVGPAQSGKTLALVDGTIAYALRYDPGDTLVVQMTQDKAREFSSPRLDRMFANSPALQGLIVRDNIHDKLFRNGMQLRIAWPTKSNLASTSYRYPISTDYDRVPDDIEGEGDLFGMLMARARTFMSRGKVIVESSPGRNLKDPNWTPHSPHEAPPVGGVLSIYNRGNRNRWHWKCPHCAEWFEAVPGLSLFRLPDERQLLADIRSIDIDKFAKQYARVICPHNGCVIDFTSRQAMNANGVWLEEGLRIDDLDRISGDPRTSDVASFWLGGVAANYSTWLALMKSHMQGLLAFAHSGDEEALQSTANLDQGIPYLSRHLASAAEQSSTPVSRAGDYERYVVPEWTRYLAAFVDVQGGRNARFVVQVHAVGAHQEEQLVDRYSIEWSKREGAGSGFAPIDPGGHPEDWDLITEKVVKATYRTPEEGRELRVYRTAVDSGGEDGVTHNAYRWFRRVRQEGLAARVRLTKGDKKTTQSWFVRESMVGFKGGTLGDIPLQLVNTNRVKDLVAASLSKRSPGPGYYHFPAPKHPVKNPDGWLPESFFDELGAEVRQADGKWSQVRPTNEAFDGCVGIKVLNLLLGVDRQGFWENPPTWARPLSENSELVNAEQRRAERAADVSQPAAAPASRQAQLPARRVSRSGYLG
jgi:phage terminase large subunit GpA-like protein